MGLTAGIVGLPNVGKSTLFNAITKKNILAANYPFATIDPNVGVVIVPDSRLDFLNELYKPKSLVPTAYENPTPDTVMAVIDLDKDEWRRFRISSIQEVEVLND